MATKRLFGVSRWIPHFFLLVLIGFGSLVQQVEAAPDVVVELISGSDFQSAHEALIETIEDDSLVVGAVLPFGDMLDRTRGEAGTPYRAAEIVQFCSSRIAGRIVLEDAAQIALCPMSVAIYATKARPDVVVMAYRSPARGSAARRQAAELLERLVKRAAELARKR